MYDAMTNDGLKTGADGQHTVVHFGYLPKGSLHALHRSLALDMSPSRLCSCSAYYRTVRRDPSAYELRLIDAYLASCRMHETASAMLSSLTTSDGEIAATLRSLVEQSKTAQRTTPPLTLKGALNALQAVGQEAIFAGIGTDTQLCFVTDEDYGALRMQGLAPEQSVRISESGVRLTLAHHTDAPKPCPPYTGELIGLLSLPDQADEAYFARLHDFLSANGHRRIRGLSVCPRGELLALLVSLCPNGCYADLSVLFQELTDTPTFSKAERAKGYLVRANEKDMKELITLSRASGLELTVFARLGNDGALTVAERDVLRAAVPISLLRGLIRTRAVSLELYPDTRHSAPSPLPTAACGEAITLGPYTAMHTALPLHDALTPRDVKQAVMQCALNLTAAGGHLDTACAAVALSVGSQTTQGALWSAVLGLYGVLNDRHIPCLAPILKADGGTVGCLSVCLFAHTV